MSRVLNCVLLQGRKLLSYNSAISFSTIKEVTKAGTSGFNQQPDLLIHNLKGCSSVNNVLEFVKTHGDIMNNKHTIEALKTIFTLQKERNEMSNKAILSHPYFEILCAKLKTQAGTTEINDVIDALKAITYCGVNSKSTIYQTLLQLIRNSLPNLSLSQIIFLDFLLKKVEQTPLNEALSIALPILFEIQAPIKMDYTNMKLLQISLQYLSTKSNINRKILDLIYDALFTRNLDQTMSLSVVWSLCDFEPEFCHPELLRRGIRNISNNITEYSFDDLETTLSKLTKRYMSRYPFYYNEEFVDLCGRQILRDDLGFENGIYYLKKANSLNHFNPYVLDYITQKCHENPDIIKTGNPMYLYILICHMAMTDYIPKHFGTILEIIKDYNYDKMREQNNMIYLTLAMSLCVLDVYPEDVIKKAMDTEYLDKLLKKRFVADAINVLQISQAVKTLKPEFSGLLPNDDYLTKIKNSLKPLYDFPIRGVLNKVFGENYVRSCVFSKMHHQIDHVIVLNRQGIPVAINSNATYLEDIKVDETGEIVLILVLPNYHYTINNRKLRGRSALTIKTLEAKGYSVVPINLDVWLNLQDYEKIPYVMREIKERTNSKELLSNSVL